MSTGPHIVLQTPKFRVIELENGNKVVEKADGADALGVERWREVKFAEAADTATMLRNWMFEHVGKCPTCNTRSGDAENL